MSNLQALLRAILSQPDQTSAGAPQWSALIAIADQGRALAGLETLDGPSQTLPMLYHLPSSAFHDIIRGGHPGHGHITLSSDRR
jgi:hypothetical protein